MEHEPWQRLTNSEGVGFQEGFVLAPIGMRANRRKGVDGWCGLEWIQRRSTP